MKNANVVYVTVSAAVSTGKSATLSSIKRLLESHGYCVAIPDRAERFNPSSDIEAAEDHEKPNKDSTVFVLTEEVLS